MPLGLLDYGITGCADPSNSTCLCDILLTVKVNKSYNLSLNYPCNLEYVTDYHFNIHVSMQLATILTSSCAAM